jgi:hypothetical protein
MVDATGDEPASHEIDHGQNATMDDAPEPRQPRRGLNSVWEDVVDHGPFPSSGDEGNASSIAFFSEGEFEREDSPAAVAASRAAVSTAPQPVKTAPTAAHRTTAQVRYDLRRCTLLKVGYRVA